MARLKTLGSGARYNRQIYSMTLWEIQWVSDVLACTGSILAGLPGPITSSRYPPCIVEGVESPLSICRKVETNNSWPYESGKPISVVGYSIAMVLSDPTAQGLMEVGSGHGDGADMFAMTAGVGTNKAAMMFSPHGLPQGATEHSYFDVYAACDKGQWQGWVHIYYTSP